MDQIAPKHTMAVDQMRKTPPHYFEHLIRTWTKFGRSGWFVVDRAIALTTKARRHEEEFLVHSTGGIGLCLGHGFRLTKFFYFFGEALFGRFRLSWRN
jgi:hypothetical protein